MIVYIAPNVLIIMIEEKGALSRFKEGAMLWRKEEGAFIRREKGTISTKEQVDVSN